MKCLNAWFHNFQLFVCIWLERNQVAYFKSNNWCTANNTLMPHLCQISLGHPDILSAPTYFDRLTDICSYYLHPKLGAPPTQSAMNHTPTGRPSTFPAEREAQSPPSIRCAFHRFTPVVSSDRSPLLLLARYGTNSAFEWVRLWQGFCISISFWWRLL